MDIHHFLAQRLRDLRAAADLSLDALAQRSGVSRSNISLIERGKSSPTAVVLDKLASALGVSVASLFEASTQATPAPLVRVADQLTWDDPATGYRRRNVSPPGMSPIKLVDVVFPPGQTVQFETGERGSTIHQLIWMIDGTMEIGHGAQRWRLEPGDCLAIQLDAPVSFFNPGNASARYLVALTGDGR